MTFEELYAVNVNAKTEKKNGLTYLSWAWAWAEFKKAYPDATYKVVKNEVGLPFFYDKDTGYMVFTEVTAGRITHEMWLPVMDSNNHAMKSEEYTIKTKYKELTVAPATMFDVNKTIMRCLTKNLAMFGLGLYIYAGEDLPGGDEAPTDSVKCTDCGNALTVVPKKDGTPWEIKDQVTYGTKMFKRTLCADCMKKEAKKK